MFFGMSYPYVTANIYGYLPEDLPHGKLFGQCWGRMLQARDRENNPPAPQSELDWISAYCDIIEKAPKYLSNRLSGCKPPGGTHLLTEKELRKEAEKHMEDLFNFMRAKNALKD